MQDLGGVLRPWLEGGAIAHVLGSSYVSQKGVWRWEPQSPETALFGNGAFAEGVKLG